MKSDGAHTPDLPRAFDGEPTLFPELPYRWQNRAEHFLGDETLQRFVAQATDTKDAGRRRGLDAAFGAEAATVRKHAGAIKEHTLEHLDHYLAQFADRAEAAGARVHFASTAEEANEIAVGIAEEIGARLCVKSKSMVTEETALLHALEKGGVEVVETDLGEFIVQLDRDAPSHIVMPMIHKDRHSVAAAFRRELGVAASDDPEELTAIARKHLRQAFLRADLGITGGNFLIAETGSVVVCTNEGNGRFCATTPKHQIAMVGIEKLVPDRERLAPFLKLLARSATGQAMTVYTQFLTGPRRPRESDGPAALDIILVDAGRTNILADERYRAALRCLRCGACQNACPVYRKATGHAYGSVYGGPIGAVITPLLKGRENYRDLPGASSLCGACREACPVDIDLPRMLVSLREDLVEASIGPLEKRRMLRLLGRAMAGRKRFRVAQGLLRGVLRLRPSGLPGPAAGWTAHRALPRPSSTTFHSWWRKHEKSRRKGDA